VTCGKIRKVGVIVIRHYGEKSASGCAVNYECMIGKFTRVVYTRKLSSINHGSESDRPNNLS